VKILLIRSVSFQQVDRQWEEWRKRFPGAEWYILTHAHGEAAAGRYEGLRRVFVYPWKSPFCWYRPASCLKGESFDCVVVPFSNASGAGFGNVMLFTLTVRARRRLSCNLSGQWREWTCFGIFASALVRGMTAVAAGCLAALAAVPFALWWVWCFLRGGTRG